MTFGSPHQGVFGVPSCQAFIGDPVLGPALCELVRRLLNEGAYIPWIQRQWPEYYTSAQNIIMSIDLIAPAQYWHDPFNHTDFLNGSIYLADINNEMDVKRDEYRENLMRLENFVMVRWRDETTIIPAASSQFGFYLPGQVRCLVSSHVNICGQDLITLPLQQLELYKSDWLGLRQLEEEGRLHFLEQAGDHMHWEWDWYVENVVIPYLVT